MQNLWPGGNMDDSQKLALLLNILNFRFNQLDQRTFPKGYYE